MEGDSGGRARGSRNGRRPIRTATPSPVLALPRRPARMGATGTPGRHRAGRARLRLGHQQRLSRVVLRRRRAEHGDELAQLLLWRRRPLGHHHRGQAARRAVVPGAVTTDLRVPRVGDRAATGDRGHADGPRPLSGGPPRRRCGRGIAGGRDHGGKPGRDPARPRQHLRLALDPSGGAGGRCGDAGVHHRPAPSPVVGRGARRFRLPDEDAAGLARPPRAVRGVSARRTHGFLPSPASGRCVVGGGHRGGLAQLDDRGDPRAGVEPPLRRRELRQLSFLAGVRLQRAGPHRHFGRVLARRVPRTLEVDRHPGPLFHGAAGQHRRRQHRVGPPPARSLRPRRSLAPAAGTRVGDRRLRRAPPGAENRPAPCCGRALVHVARVPFRVLQRGTSDQLLLPGRARAGRGGPVRLRGPARMAKTTFPRGARRARLSPCSRRSLR